MLCKLFTKNYKMLYVCMHVYLTFTVYLCVRVCVGWVRLVGLFVGVVWGLVSVITGIYISFHFICKSCFNFWFNQFIDVA